jgi:rhodanese-related sulfurtransferase
MVDITIEELHSRMKKGENITLIDVREVYENEEFNIGGSLIPIGTLMQKAPTLDIPKDTEIVVYCRSGNRSDMGKQILQMNGFENARNLLGGMLAWQDAFLQNG